MLSECSRNFSWSSLANYTLVLCYSHRLISVIQHPPSVNLARPKTCGLMTVITETDVRRAERAKVHIISVPKTSPTHAPYTNFSR